MTSSAPNKKPYRKAPPQHRETRHEPREETVDQKSQVTSVRATVCQRTCFSKAEAVELKDTEGSDAYNLSCSSSWSLASSNDKDPDGEGTHRGRTHALFRRVKSLRTKGKQKRSMRIRGLRRFLSQSEENIAVLAGGSQEGKSQSLERSLIFKEPAEVLEPRKSRQSPCSQPLKSILKHPGPLNLKSEAKFCPSQKTERLRSPLVLSPAQGECGREKTPSPDIKNQQDKAKFSQFLDEITSRVLSPTSRGSSRRAAGGSTDEESPSCSNKTDTEEDGGKREHSEKDGSWREGLPGHRGGRKSSVERQKPAKCVQAECYPREQATIKQQFRESQTRVGNKTKQQPVVTKDKAPASFDLGYLETESLSSASQGPEGRSPRASPSFNLCHHQVVQVTIADLFVVKTEKS